ncbi:MAG: hypothetical protein A3E83_03640 [Gammaproteobacteria bacterium RIFCSPHIGHO2_12_FULL_41_20]|nr:MAG: hypothetical protein A3E83_03640 [Gammaproteobacteria bacterium RIFCSPHIGHO2_12_FULL_41_20]
MRLGVLRISPCHPPAVPANTVILSVSEDLLNKHRGFIKKILADAQDDSVSGTAGHPLIFCTRTILKIVERKKEMLSCQCEN